MIAQKDKLMKKTLLLILIFAIVESPSSCQDTSLLKMLEDSVVSTNGWQNTTGTFKATQIINTPTVEAPYKKDLQFLIMHRFGKINEGGYALFGLDNASIRFGLDYGINDRLAVGIGRSSLDKVYDASFKLKLLQQNKRNIPVTISLYELLTHTTLKQPDKPYLNAKFRTAYTSQLLIARKFNSKLSLQFAPALHHFNMVPIQADKNDVLTFSIGGRYKISKRVSLNGEYNYLPNEQIISSTIYNSLSGGVDIETGGHVFQLIFTNSGGMVGPYYLTKTTGRWGKGDIYFGFNISRYFNLKTDR